MMRKLTLPFFAICGMLLLLFVGMVYAQETVVTDDDVNVIAKKLYCPVCESIPLDTCGTAACKDWRDEIRLQLEAGKTEQEIIDDFVMRFGDRVVGTPQDPVLRILSLVTPWIMILLASLGGIYALRRLQSGRIRSPISADDPLDTASDSSYQAILEQDLSGQ